MKLQALIVGSALVLFCGDLPAQSQVRAEISGIVVKGKTGQRLAGAEVKLYQLTFLPFGWRGEPRLLAVTLADKKGRFMFRTSNSGPFEVRARRYGYVMGFAQARNASADLVISMYRWHGPTLTEAIERGNRKIRQRGN